MNFIYTLKDFRCNKHCPYCITKILNRVVPEDSHKFNLMLMTLPSAYDYFILSGNGEPSLYKIEVLENIVRSVNVSSKFKEMRIQTSGLLFNQPIKLALFDGWWKEITIISPDEKEDMEFFRYSKPYFEKTYGREDVRCNYTLLLEKFQSKIYLKDIKILTEKYPYVALKILDTEDPWVVKYGVPYSFKDNILKELQPLLGIPTYSKKGGRYVWITLKGKVTMSFGKKAGHDRIQIENI